MRSILSFDLDRNVLVYAPAQNSTLAVIRLVLVLDELSSLGAAASASTAEQGRDSVRLDLLTLLRPTGFLVKKEPSCVFSAKQERGNACNLALP